MMRTIAVAGIADLQYLPQLTGCPAFETTDVPTTFADAPIGVALPPMSVPTESEYARVASSAPGVVAARLLITGTIVAANGMLSTNALATAEIHIMMRTIAKKLPPQIFSIKFAISLKPPVC